MTTFVDGVEFLEQTPDVVIGRGDERSYGPRYPAEQYKGERGNKFGIELLTKGCNFAVRVSNDALGVDFCYTDPNNPEDNGLRWELHRTETAPDGGAIYTGFIPGLKAGDVYEIHNQQPDNPGSYEQPPIDPYAKIITRAGYPDHPDSPVYCVVPPSESNPTPAEHVRIEPSQRVIYEAHIVDSTKANPKIPENLRGTYLGFSHPKHINYLKELGVTTVEIQPIHQFVSEGLLAERGKENHWGYNTLGFFAPHEGYATTPGKQLDECRQMIRALHEAGIEVMLDVVYNHTADGPRNLEVKDKDGEVIKVLHPRTYSLRGLDDGGYYKTYTKDNGEIDYWDTTGCGNTIDTTKPAAAQLVTDSLIYWAQVMGIDGARFDLAPSVGNDEFFKSLKNNPDLKDMFMVAEPWSWGAGYPKTSFASVGMPEWNGADFRDPVRDFWRGRGNLGAIAYAMRGSYDPENVVNFVTAHDGFTLRDLVSYDEKHNEANGENNRDGESNNLSWNHGVEGETDDPAIIERRRKTMHNMLNTLFMSLGIPMLRAGDEKLHTQHGNNNAYCADIDRGPDNRTPDIHSLNWNLSPEQQGMFNVVSSLIAIRKRSNAGNPRTAPAMYSLWGQRIEHDDSYLGESGVLGVHIPGGEANNAESYITYINGSQNSVRISLPPLSGEYDVVSDSETGEANPAGIRVVSDSLAVGGMSSVILRLRRQSSEQTLAQPTTAPEQAMA